MLVHFLFANAMTRYDHATHQGFADQGRHDGLAVLRQHVDTGLMARRSAAFAPSLAQRLAATPPAARPLLRHNPVRAAAQQGVAPVQYRCLLS